MLCDHRLDHVHLVCCFTRGDRSLDWVNPFARHDVFERSCFLFRFHCLLCSFCVHVGEIQDVALWIHHSEHPGSAAVALAIPNFLLNHIGGLPSFNSFAFFSASSSTLKSMSVYGVLSSGLGLALIRVAQSCKLLKIRGSFRRCQFEDFLWLGIDIVSRELRS